MKYKIYNWSFNKNSVGYIVAENDEIVFGNYRKSKFPSLEDLVRSFGIGVFLRMTFTDEILDIIHTRDMKPILECDSIEDICKLKEIYPELFI